MSERKHDRHHDEIDRANECEDPAILTLATSLAGSRVGKAGVGIKRIAAHFADDEPACDKQAEHNQKTKSESDKIGLRVIRVVLRL